MQTITPDEMIAPVRCRCGAIYDSARVRVIQRFADCSVWDAPCCGLRTDDNIWHTSHNFTKIDRRHVTEPQMLFDGTYRMPGRLVLTYAGWSE